MTSHGYMVRVLLEDPVTAERMLLDYYPQPAWTPVPWHGFQDPESHALAR
jgi:hypothetical protein